MVLGHTKSGEYVLVVVSAVVEEQHFASYNSSIRSRRACALSHALASPDRAHAFSTMLKLMVSGRMFLSFKFTSEFDCTHLSSASSNISCAFCADPLLELLANASNS